MEILPITGDGKNNLDFHLAYYLGRLVHEFSQGEFLILSKDKGFDSLIGHLVEKGQNCRRIERIPQLLKTPAKAASNPDLRFHQLRDHLLKHEKNRPKDHKSLMHFIESMFKKHPLEEWERLAKKLVSSKFVAMEGTSLIYKK